MFNINVSGDYGDLSGFEGKIKKAIKQAHISAARRFKPIMRQVLGRGPGRSSPGSPPNMQSGELVDKSRATVKGIDSIEMQENASYAAYLEDGTSRMAARPHMQEIGARMLVQLETYVYSSLGKII
jgi:hypothetical protein